MVKMGPQRVSLGSPGDLGDGASGKPQSCPRRVETESGPPAPIFMVPWAPCGPGHFRPAQLKQSESASEFSWSSLREYGLDSDSMCC